MLRHTGLLITLFTILCVQQTCQGQSRKLKNVREQFLKEAEVQKVPSIDAIIWSPKDSLAIDYHNPDVLNIHEYGLGSTTKMLSAIVVMDLIERDSIDLEIPINYYLREQGREAWQGIKVKQLLNHTSGIVDYTRNPDWIKMVTAQQSPRTTQERLALVIDSLSQPQGIFHYSNTNYVLLELLIETITGDNYSIVFNDFFKQRDLDGIYLPTSIDSTQTFFAQDLTAVSNVTNTQEYYGYAGDARASPRDLLDLFKKLFIDHSILKPETLQLMQSWITMGTMTIQMDNAGIQNYGYGFMKLDFGDTQLLGHSGGTLKYQSFAFIDPATQTVIVAMTNASGAHYNNAFVQHLIPILLTAID
ncbi:serine hydrolase domain-containing protein [Nonlabens ponticola]|uniref:Class A beta-lactamase-related serine hydrolase n=1 Tax=Nonlabens ponticola TaxID=2496866 RepID=A0A3S9MZA0_9FLAO|nr:serine hydrolase domain-containing protein [Nonlabens ponticola]AZQ44487.1 class A beta-lactamase-related serine hydrolase [Nonlabens ponticola]